MDLIIDGLLIAGALFAGAYCWVLSTRVRALKSLDSGLGGAIVQLTRQIELARATLDEARAGSRETRQDLAQLVARSDTAAAQLRLLLAAIEKTGPPAQSAPTAVAFVASLLASDLSAAPPEPVVSPPAAVDDRAVRRREGPKLVTLPEPEPDQAPVSIFGAEPDDAVAVPKPRRSLALDGLLRRRPAPEQPPAARSEEELIAALSALAAGGDR